jgi:hypothetical protein
VSTCTKDRILSFCWKSKLRSLRKCSWSGGSSRWSSFCLNQMYGSEALRWGEFVFWECSGFKIPRLRQRSVVSPISYLRIRICAVGPVGRFDDAGGSACSCSFATSLSGFLLDWWLRAISCSCESTLSEYVRAEAQDRMSRGREKNRDVVKPFASPRVGANVEAILNEWRGVYVQNFKRLSCRDDGGFPSETQVSRCSMAAVCLAGCSERRSFIRRVRVGAISKCPKICFCRRELT